MPQRSKAFEADKASDAVGGLAEPFDVYSNSERDRPVSIEYILNSTDLSATVYIDKIVILIPTIETKISEKREYNKIHAAEELPGEHDIKKWINFLPPLKSIKQNTLQNVSEQFQKEFISNLSSGSK